MLKSFIGGIAVRHPALKKMSVAKFASLLGYTKLTYKEHLLTVIPVFLFQGSSLRYNRIQYYRKIQSPEPTAYVK